MLPPEEFAHFKLLVDAPEGGVLEKTRNGRSLSQRVNELVRRGLRQEMYERLEQEAREFYRTPLDPDGIAERKAFFALSKRSLARDKD